MGVVHEAEPLEGGQRVALKTVDVPRATGLAALRREIEALRRIVHPSIVRIVDDGVDDGVPWYAMELLEGETLKDFLARLWTDYSDTPTLSLNEAEFGFDVRRSVAVEAARQNRPPAAAGRLEDVLTLLVGVCDALELVHGLGIVHRDLKPSNIFLREDGRPSLTDFGLAISWGDPAGRDVLVDARCQAGTPAYIAPEQISGDSVDGRADLYALGCVMYECVTGHAPFPRFTSMALQGHLHTDPYSPSSVVLDVPPALEALILRLLAKHPRDRPAYASDVRATLLALGARAAIAEKPTTPYLYRAGLQGRSSELQMLLDRLESVSRGGGGVALVRGESGIGKTRLVSELASTAHRSHRFRVISGECTPSEIHDHAPSAPGTTPLEPLRPLLTAIADDCRERGAEVTQRVLGELGRFLIPFEPALATLPGAPAASIGEVSVEWLFPALTRALVTFAETRPLLLLLDDLQWADQTTLELLLSLDPVELAAHDVLIVGLYRTEEENAALEQLHLRYEGSTVSLKRLDVGSLRRTVGDMLAIDSVPSELTDYLLEQTDGIPFFIGEYLRMAIDSRLLERDAEGRWELRLADSRSSELRRLLPAEAMGNRSLPAGVRDVAVRRLTTLSDGARHLAQVAAVLGRVVDPDLLIAVASLDRNRVFDLSVELIQRGILETSGGEGWRFCHDKLKEAAYAATPTAERASLHQRTAESLEDRGERDHFAIANHYRLGIWKARPSRSFDACVDAGLRALDEFAASDALRYFQSAFEIATATDHPTDARFHAGWGEACVRLERPDDAIVHLRQALRTETSATRRARIHVNLAFVHLTNFRADDAATECRAALDLLGTGASAPTRILDAVAALATSVWSQPDPSPSEIERLKTTASVFRIYQLAAYYRMDSLGFTASGLRSFLVSRRLARRPEAVPGLACTALSLAGLRLFNASSATARSAVRLADELHDPGSQAVARSVECLTHTFRGDITRALTEYRVTLSLFGSWLSGLDHINATGDMIWVLAMLGHSREARSIGEMQLANLRRARGLGGHAEGHTAQAFPQLVVEPMLGNFEAPKAYLAEADAPRLADIRFHRVFVSACKVMWCVESGELGAPFEAAVEEYLRLAPPPELTILHINAFHVFHAYGRLALLSVATPADERRAMTRFREALGLLKRVGTHPIFLAHRLVLSAAKLRLEGKDNHAALARAEDSASTTDNRWALFELELERARSCRSTQRVVHLDSAREIARREGWINRESRLEREIRAAR